MYNLDCVLNGNQEKKTKTKKKNMVKFTNHLVISRTHFSVCPANYQRKEGMTNGAKQ